MEQWSNGAIESSIPNDALRLHSVSFCSIVHKRRDNACHARLHTLCPYSIISMSSSATVAAAGAAVCDLSFLAGVAVSPPTVFALPQ
jgi:hypothetical protein